MLNKLKHGDIEKQNVQVGKRGTCPSPVHFVFSFDSLEFLPEGSFLMIAECW